MCYKVPEEFEEEIPAMVMRDMLCGAVLSCPTKDCRECILDAEPTVFADWLRSCLK